MIRAIIFLGNPGPEYAITRHNAAWCLLDTLPEAQGTWQRKFHGLHMQVAMAGATRSLLKPLTFMNRSGDSVGALVAFYRFDPESILVVHDDVEMNFGCIGWKRGGGLGGHNGLKSITATLQTSDYFRLRIGVSRPSVGTVSSHVLGRFSDGEQARLPEVWRRAGDVLAHALEVADPLALESTYRKICVF
jgi:peptidyl-tRNA hydrolase, PTH1 family